MVTPLHIRLHDDSTYCGISWHTEYGPLWIETAAAIAAAKAGRTLCYDCYYLWRVDKNLQSIL